GGGEARPDDEPVLRGPRVTRREGLDGGAPLGVEGLQLGGEEHRVAAARPVERGDAQAVPGDREAPAPGGHRQPAAAAEAREGARAVVLVALQCRLQVRAGAEPVLPQPLTDAAVVVDLAVADEPDLLLAAGKRLRAGAGVGDAEVPGAEPALT